MTTENRRSTFGKWLLRAALLGHVLLVLALMPPRFFAASVPITGFDFALHQYHFDRVLRAFADHGKLWAWDPSLIAGNPVGVIEDLTSKGTELWLIVLGKLGIDRHRALYLIVLVTHLGVPFTGYASARCFELDRSRARIVAVLWGLLWWFDSSIRIAWWVGMFSWVGSIQLLVLAVGLLQLGVVRGSRRALVGLAVVAPAITLHHPFAPLSIAPACLLLVVKHRRALDARALVGLGVAALLAVATTLVWIRPFRAYRSQFVDFLAIGAPGIEYLVYDFLDVCKSYLNTGYPVRSLFRFGCFAAAGVIIVRWIRERDSRGVTFAALICTGLLWGYFGGYLTTTRQTQPYRQVMVAALAAAIPAAVLLPEIGSRAALRALPQNAKLLIGGLALVAAPRVYNAIASALPWLWPTPVRLHSQDPPLPPLGPDHQLEAPRFEYIAPLREWLEVSEVLRREHGGRGRVLVGEWIIAEWLAATTSLPYVGGHPDRPVLQNDANLFSFDRGDKISRADLEAYFERFAVGFYVGGAYRSVVERYPGLLKPVRVVGPYRIYRVVAEPSYVAMGRGRIAEQRLNQIRVEGAEGPELVLRFHWLDSLRCRPNCRVERAETAGARAGFLRIPSPPPNFEIYNSYVLP